MSTAEMVDTLTDVVSIESSIIDSLYSRLSQLMAADELDNMEELAMMEEATEKMSRVRR